MNPGESTAQPQTTKPLQISLLHRALESDKRRGQRLSTRELEAELCRIWKGVLGNKEIGTNDNFFRIGGNSLLAILAINRMNECGIDVAPREFFQRPTVAAIAAALSDRVNGQLRVTQTVEQRVRRQEHAAGDQSALLALQPNGSKPPFFLVYPDLYRDLLHYLDSDLPIYGLLGLDLIGMHALQKRVEHRASYYVTEIQGIQPAGPYFLGGRCMGGLVAFEMAQQLLAQGHKVAMLALFDTPAPPIHLNFSATQNDLHDGNLLRLGPKERLKYMLWRMAFKAYLGIESLLPHGRQDVDRQAFGRYAPQLYTGRLVYFFAPETRAMSSFGRQWAWNQIASGGIEFHVVPGRMASMMREPYVQILAHKLSACLQKVCA